MKRMDGKTSLIILIACAVVYSANLRVVGGGDCWAPRYIPLSLLKEGDLDLNEFGGLKFGIIEVPRRGKLYRVFMSPVLSGVLATPLYAGAIVLGIPLTRLSLAYLGKLAATLYSSLSVVFIFLILKRLLPRKVAVFLALVYAFGTCTWAISSQSLWQHGLSQCLLAAGLYCFFRAPEEERYAGYAGGMFSLATLARYFNGIMAAIMLVYVVQRYRSQVLKFLLFSVPAALFYFIYHWYYFGRPMHPITNLGFESFTFPFLPGLAGILFSPNRGLFFISPVFLFSLLGAVKAWGDDSEHRVLYRYLTVVVATVVVLIARWFMWWGGHCYGYRMLVDLTPFLMVLMVPAYRVVMRGKLIRFLFLISVVWSGAIQILGALYYEDIWNPKVEIDRYPERVWWLKGGQLHYLIRHAAHNGWKVRRTVLLPPRHQHSKRYW